MAVFNQINFPSHQGLPFQGNPPTIDGFTELHPGLPPTSWRLEAGYVGGPQFDYLGSGGVLPNASFRGVKESGADFLILSFEIRFDPSFDDRDRALIIIRPNAANGSSANDRRIDIFPVTEGTVGPGGAPAGGGAAPLPTDPADISALEYRTNRAAREVKTYQRTGGTPRWAPITVNNLLVKVSSSAPSASGPPSRNWTVEVRIPTTQAQGGGSWVDIPGTFGLYVNLMRFCTPGATGCAGPEIDGYFSSQFTWPFDPANPVASAITDVTTGGAADDDWDAPGALGTATINGPAAQGVKFKDGWQGIGVLSGGAIGGTLDLSFAGATNQLIARLINDHPTNVAQGPISAEFRLAGFGLGTYGNQAAWDKTPSVLNPASTPVANPNIAANGGTADITSTWTATQQQVDDYAGVWSDQCLWVTLDAPGASSNPSPGVFFAENSVRRNLTVKQASETETAATVSGTVPDAEVDNGEIDYWIYSVALRLYPYRFEPRIVAVNLDSAVGPGQVFDALNTSPLLTGEAAEAEKESASFLWVNSGYWRTPETLTVDGNRYRLWVNSGNFGSVVQHVLEQGQTIDDIGIRAELLGTDVRPGRYGGVHFRVPHKGAKHLWGMIRAGTPGELERPFERREDPVPPKRHEPGGTGGGPELPQGCRQLLANIPGAIVTAVAGLIKRVRQ